MVCLLIHITSILEAWFAYGGRDLLVFWSKTQWYKWEPFLWLQWSLEIFLFPLSNLNLFIKEQKLFFYSGFGRVTLLESSTSASQLWASSAGAVCGLHKSIPEPWRKWELLGSGSSVHLVSPSIHLGFSALALGKGYCSEFLCCCGSLLGKEKCSDGKAKWFFVL